MGNSHSFRYAHLADLHLGSWREPKMREISTKVFLRAIDDCIEAGVDFILFAGDLFNTSMPAVDTLKIVTKKLKELQEKGIPLYAIAGSHDFSPSGKTMLDVLENAGLLVNVCKGSVDPETKLLNLSVVVDQKTGAKIAGIIGRRGMLDRTYYENLNRVELEKEGGYKIFMFHTTLTELKPKHLEMLDSQPASFLPKSFNYYAGGHIHHRNLIEIPEYGTLTYTGALFPNNFAELEKYSYGGFYLVDVQKVEEGNGEGNFSQSIEWKAVQVVKHKKIIFDCNAKTALQVEKELHDSLKEEDLSNTLITLRLFGSLLEGKGSDINFKEVFEQWYAQGAYFIMKHTSKLVSPEFEEISLSSSQQSPELVEKELIKEHAGQGVFSPALTESLATSLLAGLHTKKQEGEKSYDFQKRVFAELDTLFQKHQEKKNV